jgi:hypothetical protein
MRKHLDVEDGSKAHTESTQNVMVLHINFRNAENRGVKLITEYNISVRDMVLIFLLLSKVVPILYPKSEWPP